MVTLAALSSLTYKGTTLQDFPRIWLQITEGRPGASPEVRGDNTTTPYRRGQTYGPKRATRLPVTLEGWVAGDGSTEDGNRGDTAVAIQELAALFDVEGGVGTLSARDMDGTIWTIDCYPEVFLPDAMPRVPGHVGVTVRLIAIDPPEWVAAGS